MITAIDANILLDILLPNPGVLRCFDAGT